MMKAFERSLNTDAPKHLARVEKFVNKDEARQRQYKKFKQQYEEVKSKWEKNKAEIQGSANVKFAVVVQNSLG